MEQLSFTYSSPNVYMYSRGSTTRDLKIFKVWYGIPGRTAFTSPCVISPLLIRKLVFAFLLVSLIVTGFRYFSTAASLETPRMASVVRLRYPYIPTLLLSNIGKLT